MNTRHTLYRIPAATALLIAFVACTKDERTDGDRLPEGQYPLEIARITLSVEGGQAQPWGARQTRVCEIADGTGSVFDAGDRFAVQIDGKDEVGTYAVQDNNTVKAETPLYWSDSGEHTVTAWYPAGDGTLDLSNQSQNLAYLLSGTGTGNYQTQVTLTFTHQLAKVRVTPTGDALGEVQSLQLYTYTQCTYEKGKAGQGSQEGWIEMKPCEYTENGVTITCWEANVVPGHEIKQLRANGTEERDLSASITPVAGAFYNITLNYDKGYTISEDGKTYNVYSARGLQAWNKAVQGDLSLNCTLTADIDFTGMTWTPVAQTAYGPTMGYNATFDGQGHRITGLSLSPDSPSNGNAAMFDGIGSNGQVKNLQLADVNYTMDENRMSSGLVLINFGTITACSVTGTLSTNSSVGGIAVGNHGTITACWFNGTLSGPNTGGIAVFNHRSITACYWGGNAANGIYNDNSDATTKVNAGESWQKAVEDMNAALNGNDCLWTLGTDGLPVLTPAN